MEPTLYILIRKDIPDMNPGKAAAQAAHAQADFAHRMTNYEEIDDWLQGRHFGRTLVVMATLEEIEYFGRYCRFSDVTIDPTYPWKNWYGETFVGPFVTCGWVYVSGNKVTDVELKLTNLKLMP